MKRVALKSWVFLLSFAGIWLTALWAGPQAVPTPSSINLPSGVQFVTNVEGVTEYRLANGLRVLLIPDNSVPTVTVNMMYCVGSSDDPGDEAGTASLVQRLAARGSQRHPNIAGEVSDHSGRSGRGVGATRDSTAYTETFPASEENLKWAFDLESDRMVNATVSQKDFESARASVRTVLENAVGGGSGVSTDRLYASAYLLHNYRLPVSGVRAGIENVTLERLQAFYRSWYRPDNALLVVSGKIDPALSLGLINVSFGAIPAPTSRLAPVHQQEPVQDGERVVTIRRGSSKEVDAAYHIPAASHPNFAAINVLAGVLGSYSSGRLYDALVMTKRATGVYSSALALRDPGLLYFYAMLDPKQSLDPAREALLATVEEVVSRPPTDEEVAHARQQLLTTLENNLNLSQNTGTQLVAWAARGDWRLLYLYRDNLRNVTAEDVKRVAAAYLKPANRTVVVAIPEDAPAYAEIPPAPSVAELVKSYKGGAAVSEGEAFEPTSANVEARARRFTLPNGTKVALVPIKRRGATVAAYMTLHFGDEQSLKNHRFDAQLISGYLVDSILLRGTTRRTREQLAAEMDRIKAPWSLSGTASSITAEVRTVRTSLPGAIKLLAEMLREPSFPEKDVNLLKQAWVAALERSVGTASAISSSNLARHLSPYPKDDIRSVLSIEEQIEGIKAVTSAQARKFYADFFGGSNGEIAIVGDFDAQEISQVLTDSLGTWKSPRSFRDVPTLYHEVQPVNRSIETPGLTGAAYYAGMNIPMRDDDPDYPALMLANNMLRSRLQARIAPAGAASSLYTFFSADSSAKLAQFQSTNLLDVKPKDIDAMDIAFKDEMARAFKDGFTADELNTARSAWMQTRRLPLTLLSQDSSLASRLARYQFLDRPLAWDEALEQKVSDLTIERLNAAWRKYIDPVKVSIFKAGDFANAAAAAKK